MHSRRSILGPETDFWLLGGLSIVFCIFLALANIFRTETNPIGAHFQQFPATFALLAFAFNNPHFMISYKFGYGRGHSFIFQHWFSLILMPASLLGLYALAYCCYSAPIPKFLGFDLWVRLWALLGIEMIRGGVENIGQAVMSLTVWLMYIMVGWHYAKQCLGCMLVYSRYDQYPVTLAQRRLLKFNLFSLAFYYFLYSMEYMGNIGGQNSFFNIPMLRVYFPAWVNWISLVSVGLSLGSVLYFFFYRNWRSFGALPSRNFLVPLVSLYAWWLPITEQREYYIFAVPFFHSLQYLMFAQRLARHRLQASWFPRTRLFIGAVALVLAGFAAFEWLPYALDRGLGTEWHQSSGFFLLSILVFINIHHYLIDSVVWKFHQGDVRSAFLDSDSANLTENA